ncbi:MAG TPA: VTT domain-containing protein [Gaiellaceae bacterium]|nr:VTT domain-containing protein [Gaiellaceae bacterium]
MLFSIFGWLTDLVSGHWWTYALVFGLAAIDVDVPLVPAETVVIVAAIAAANGKLSLWVVVACAWAGAVLGDNFTYWLGRKAGEPAYRRLFRGGKAERRYEWAKRVLDEHGAWIVPAARFVPGGRTATTFAAGGVEMRYAVFLAAEVAAALAWALYVSLIGYLGGRTFAASSWKSFAVAFGIAAAISAAGVVYWRVEERRSE